MQNEPAPMPTTGTHASDALQAANAAPAQASRRKVFISYSRSDGHYLDELITYLKPYIRMNAIEVWCDTQIKSGEKWEDLIEQAIEEARVAVLLASKSFFASDFIYYRELTPLLEAYKAGEVTLLPVIVSSVSFADTPLAGIQAVNDPKNPLSKMKTSQRDELWVKVVKDIKRVLNVK